MTLKQHADFNNPRGHAIAAMQASISPEQWANNAKFITSLRQEIAAHPVSRHPAITILNRGSLGFDVLRGIHLDYRHAIVQIFTDALLAAQMQSRQLEPRLAPASKMAGRFLLTLNVLDEFGFRPELDENESYSGNPAYAHYPLFEAVLDQYGVQPTERAIFSPSQIASKVRVFLENTYVSYINVVALLAVAEEEVILFSSPLRQATSAVGINVDQGYYHVHGASEDETADASDDAHEDDLWQLLIQALTEQDYLPIRTLCLEYCDLWEQFWDEQLRRAADL